MRGPGLSPLLLAATASTQLFECGPNPREAGQLVLMVSPAVYLLGVALAALLLHLWRAERPVWPPPWTALAALGAVHVALAALAWPTSAPTPDGRPSHVDGGTLVLALWLYGVSYATVMLLALRLAIARAPRAAGLAAHLAPLLVFTLPALLLATGRLRDGWFWQHNHAERYFTEAGREGWIAGPILIALLVEVLVRRRRVRSPRRRPR